MFVLFGDNAPRLTGSLESHEFEYTLALWCLLWPEIPENVIKEDIASCVVYQTVGELQVGHVVIDRSAVGYHSLHHVSGDHDPAETQESCFWWVHVWMSVIASQKCAPVIGAACMCHRGVSIIGNQPVETLVGEEADVLPLWTRHKATARVEVAQQQDVLSSESNGFFFSPFPAYVVLLSVLYKFEFCELLLVLHWT